MALRKDIRKILEEHDFYHDIRLDPEDDGYMLSVTNIGDPVNVPDKCKECMRSVNEFLVIPWEHIYTLVEALITRIKRKDSMGIIATPSPEELVKIVKQCMIPAGAEKEWKGWDEQAWLDNAKAAIGRLRQL